MAIFFGSFNYPFFKFRCNYGLKDIAKNLNVFIKKITSLFVQSKTTR